MRIATTTTNIHQFIRVIHHTVAYFNSYSIIQWIVGGRSNWGLIFLNYCIPLECPRLHFDAFRLIPTLVLVLLLSYNTITIFAFTAVWVLCDLLVCLWDCRGGACLFVCVVTSVDFCRDSALARQIDGRFMFMTSCLCCIVMLCLLLRGEVSSIRSDKYYRKYKVTQQTNPWI